MKFFDPTLKLRYRQAPLAMHGAEFCKLGHELVERIAELFDELPQRPVTSGESPQAIRQLLGAAPLPEKGAAVNPNVGAFTLSPVATEIEAQTIRWIADLIGYPRTCGGILVSGGNMANIDRPPQCERGTRRPLPMTTMPQPLGVLGTTTGDSDVTLRPMQPADADLLFTMHQRLSPESIYYRYLQYRRPTLAEITTVCRLAPARGAGFVALHQAPAADAPPIIVGMAYYIREAHALEPTAEPGILVEDRFQDQGIGRLLWQQMQRHAQMAGVRRLRVWSPPHNQRLAQLVRGGGLPYQTKAYGDLHEYLVDLDEPLRYSNDRRPSQPISEILLNQYRQVNERLVWN